MNTQTLIKQTKTITSQTFKQKIQTATQQLQTQPKLKKLPTNRQAIIVGDLHGDLQSLTTILKQSKAIKLMQTHPDTTMIFLGDYGDRGLDQIEVYDVVLSLFLAFPQQVILLRGNHEGPANLMAHPHDLPLRLEDKFGADGTEIYRLMQKMFDSLGNAVYVKERFLMVHGGVSPKIGSLNDLANPSGEMLEDLLWSDPDDTVEDVASSFRGAGIVFGKKVTTEVLSKVNAKILIRGHEAVDEGYNLNHDGKVLTLFSTKTRPYTNQYAAYLQVDLSKKFQTANELVPYIHQF